MIFVIGFRQQAQIDFKIEGLYQAPLGFGLSRELGHLDQAGVFRPEDLANMVVGASGGKEFNIRVDGLEVRNERFKPLFVGNTDQYPGDFYLVIDFLYNIHAHIFTSLR